MIKITAMPTIPASLQLVQWNPITAQWRRTPMPRPYKRYIIQNKTLTTITI
jgi:hypothetical protein